MHARPQLEEAILYFADSQRSRDFMVAARWRDRIVKCPECGSERLCYLAKNRVWKCYGEHRKPRFSVKTGTILEDSAVPLEKWLPALWLVLSGQDAVISSWQLHRTLGVSQKTAWFILHRIRVAMQSKAFGRGRSDSGCETPVGRKVRNSDDDCGGRARPDPAARQFENTPEFWIFTDGMRRLLRLRKPELDAMLRDAKYASPRFGNPFAPGRKKKGIRINE